jgi:deoxycytidylate deaminase
VRTNSEGKYRNSAPCQHCFNVINELNIKKIVFSTDDNFEIHKPSEYTTTHISHGNRFLNKNNILVH